MHLYLVEYAGCTSMCDGKARGELGWDVPNYPHPPCTKRVNCSIRATLFMNVNFFTSFDSLLLKRIVCWFDPQIEFSFSTPKRRSWCEVPHDKYAIVQDLPHSNHLETNFLGSNTIPHVFHGIRMHVFSCLNNLFSSGIEFFF